MTCKCVYATAANTPSVRSGHEMGGYLKEECDECRKEHESEEKARREAKTGWIKIAHYFYPQGEIVISGRDGILRVRTEKGEFPVCPIRKVRFAHPAEEEDCALAIPTYEEIGLYYSYEMPGTDWS